MPGSCQLQEITCKAEMTSSLSNVNLSISSKYDHFVCLLVIFISYFMNQIFFVYFSISGAFIFNFLFLCF